MIQTRIELPPIENARFMNYTIWQPDTKRIPWAIHMQGWMESGIDIWLYHEQIECGYYFFKNCHFKTAQAFAGFIRKQLVLLKNVFHKDLDVRGIDYTALVEGYREGVKRAGSVHISKGHDNERTNND